MENLKNYSETQLLKFINDAERDHLDKKKAIIDIYDKLNSEVEKLNIIEERYIMLIKELNERG